MSKTTDLTASSNNLAKEIQNLGNLIHEIESLDKTVGTDRSEHIKKIRTLIRKIEDEIVRRYTP